MEATPPPVSPETSAAGTENARVANAREEGNSEQDNARGDGSQNEAESGTGDEQNYIASFASRRHLMPHWSNVLATSRHPESGSLRVLVLTRPRGASGAQLSLELAFINLGQPHVVANVVSNPDPDPYSVFRLQAVLVHDLSEAQINSLGPTFKLSPAVFEEHLVQSGYTPNSYENQDSSTWPTQFLQKQHISLRWFSLVLRNDEEPRDDANRRLLLEDDLEWKYAANVNRAGLAGPNSWKKRQMSTMTNIFRREWPLSPLHRSLKKRLIPSERDQGYLIQVDEDKELDSGPDEEEDYVVAWEERVTFSWGRRDHGILPVLFFDPLPRMRLYGDVASGGEATLGHLMPFSRRLAPRGPPPVQQLDDNNPADLDTVGEYIASVDSADFDALDWLARFVRESGPQENRSPLDLLLLAVFQVVRQDTVVLLGHIGRVLDKIVSGSTNERIMQEQLEHWRTVLARVQSELPALEKSMGEFFAFVYAKPGQTYGPPPPCLSAALRDLQADTAAMTERCLRVQNSLRSEMSLLESKRGIEEAESVSRLTELAFIFIPLTFAASLFSMQIKELDGNPPPAYAFVTAAVVAVTVSYGLRLVQRSTAVSESLRKWEEQIRDDKQVSTRIIPIRNIASWLVSKFRFKLLIFFASIGCFSVVTATLWSRTAMDSSLKGVMTGLVLLCMLLLLVITSRSTFGALDTWSSSAKFSYLVSRGNNIYGFGRLWRRPPRVRDPARRGGTSDGAGNSADATQQGVQDDSRV